MKIRTCFVSNSSASSYVCDVCGAEAVGWESPDGFRDCQSGHGLCEECQDFDAILTEAVSKPLKEALAIVGLSEEDCIEETIEADWEDLDSEARRDWINDIIWEGELTPELCPVCSFEVLIPNDIANYLLKTSGVSWDTVFTHVKSMNKRRKKLRDDEYIAYVCAKLGVDTIELSEKIKKTYKTYDDFQKFLRSK